MAGGNGVEAERKRTVKQGGELDLLVAAQARVRSPARLVLGNEVVDHVGLETLSEIPDVERDSEHIGATAGVVRVLDGAATT